MSSSLLRIGAVSAASLFAVWAAPTARADVLQTKDGKWAPRGITLGAKAQPTLAVMEEHRTKRIDPLNYDVVKLGGIDVPAASVRRVWVYEAELNTSFGEGFRSADGGQFSDAASAFQAAADGLKGVARMVALYQQCLALAAANDAEGMVTAIETLLAEFPKSLYLPELQMRRARVLRARGQVDAAMAALDKVTQAPGMPRRAVYEAELLRIFLTKQFDAGGDPARWAEVEAAYRERLTQIERESAKDEVEAVRLMAMAGVARSLVFQGKAGEAAPLLETAAAAPEGVLSGQALASVYAGLGDTVLAEARDVQAKAAGDKALKARSAELLDQALRHYLRVALLYVDDADPGDLLHARQHVARTLVFLFNLSDETNCEAADRALGYYKLALDMMGGGALRNALTREAKDLVTRREKACGKKK